MAVEKKMCVNHPERPAQGICVMTRNPICSECSTRYEGVNYSREGLELLKQQRLAKSRDGAKRGLLKYCLWLAFPPSVLLMYAVYHRLFSGIIDLLQAD